MGKFEFASLCSLPSPAVALAALLRRAGGWRFARAGGRQPPKTQKPPPPKPPQSPSSIGLNAVCPPPLPCRLYAHGSPPVVTCSTFMTCFTWTINPNQTAMISHPPSQMCPILCSVRPWCVFPPRSSLSDSDGSDGSDGRSSKRKRRRRDKSSSGRPTGHPEHSCHA